jgi:ISXO2-like transposase domain
MAGRGAGRGVGGGRPRAPEEIIPQANIVAPNLMVVDMKFRRLVTLAGLDSDDPNVDPTTCRRWLASQGLLANSRECDVCPGHVRCRLMHAANAADDCEWRCPNFANCNFRSSIRDGSFFAGSHLTLQQILELIYHWARDHKQSELMDEIDISDHPAVDWYNFIRDICGMWVADHSAPIGGVDAAGNPIEVQIDESKFMHRKYHRGAYRDGHWVFGGVEVGVPHPNCFLVICPGNRRNAATLLPLIEQWVLPGSRVVSDMWAAYGGIANLPGGYQHLTVNHRLNFVDPVTGAHTNNVEGQWSHVKRKFRAMSGTSDALFDSYLLEYMWRKAHTGNIFMNILYWIRHYY